MHACMRYYKPNFIKKVKIYVTYSDFTSPLPCVISPTTTSSAEGKMENSSADDKSNLLTNHATQADDIPANNSLDPTRCPGMHSLISSKAHSVSESRSPANW